MAPAWPGSAAGAWTREGRGLGGVASPLPGAPRGACAVRAVPVRRGGHVGARAVPARHRAERRLGRVGRHGPHQGVRQGGGLLQERPEEWGVRRARRQAGAAAGDEEEEQQEEQEQKEGQRGAVEGW